MTHNNTLFISYAREDADFALRLAKDLRAAGVAIWIDQLDIDAGERWDDAIEQALNACARLLIVLSPASAESKNVKDEIAFALHEDKPIVPVLFQACKIPYRLLRMQHIDFTKDYQSSLQRLLATLGIEEKPVARMQEEPRPAPKPQPEPAPVVAPPPLAPTPRSEPKQIPVIEKKPEPRPAASVQTSFPQPNKTTFAWQRYAGAFAVIAGLVFVIWKEIDWNSSSSQEPPVTKKAEDASVTQPEQPRIRPKPDGMVYIPAGEFIMGDSTSNQSDEKPAHRVRVNAFYLDQYEVTVAQFRRFVAAKNYKTEAENGDGSYMWEGTEWKKRAGINWRHDAEGNTAQDNHPVIHVSWNDAKAYAAWAKKRLPTEAEWEYAARSGSKNYKYAWGNGDPVGKNGGNIADETAKRRFNWAGTWEGYNDGYAITAPVGSFNPNTFGLYDMTGNVWEWCEDWYDAKYYEKRIADNPKGPSTGEYRVLRGGAWNNEPSNVRGANRDRLSASNRNYNVGFRCAQDAL